MLLFSCCCYYKNRNAIMFELQQTIKLFELTYSLTDDLYIKQPKAGGKYKKYIFVSIFNH